MFSKLVKQMYRKTISGPPGSLKVGETRKTQAKRTAAAATGTISAIATTKTTVTKHNHDDKEQNGHAPDVDRVMIGADGN